MKKAAVGLSLLTLMLAACSKHKCEPPPQGELITAKPPEMSDEEYRERLRRDQQQAREAWEKCREKQ